MFGQCTFSCFRKCLKYFWDSVVPFLGQCTYYFWEIVRAVFETVYVLSICIYAELYSILSCDSSLIKQLLVKNGKFA